MPSATPQETQNQIVELRKADPKLWSHSKIAKHLSVDEMTVLRVLKKAGLTKPRQASSAAPASPPPAPLAPPPAPPATPSSPPSGGLPVTPAGAALQELQPAPPPHRVKASPPLTCSDCSGQFTLDPGEVLKGAKCPHCGVVFD